MRIYTYPKHRDQQCSLFSIRSIRITATGDVVLHNTDFLSPKRNAGSSILIPIIRSLYRKPRTYSLLASLQQNNNGMGMTNSAGGMGGMGGQPMYPQMQIGMGQQGGMMFNQGSMGMMGGNMTLQQQQQQMMMMQQQMQMQGGMMQPQMGNMMGMNMMGGTQNQPQQKNNMNGNGNNMGW